MIGATTEMPLDCLGGGQGPGSAVAAHNNGVGSKLWGRWRGDAGMHGRLRRGVCEAKEVWRL